MYVLKSNDGRYVTAHFDGKTNTPSLTDNAGLAYVFDEKNREQTRAQVAHFFPGIQLTEVSGHLSGYKFIEEDSHGRD
jgi:hypothetical protein